MNRQNIKMLAFLSVVIIIGAISIIFPKLDVAIAQSDDLLYDDWEDCIATQTEEFCRRSGFRPPGRQWNLRLPTRQRLHRRRPTQRRPHLSRQQRRTRLSPMTSCTTIGTIAGQLRPSSSAGAWASYRLGKSRRRRQRTPLSRRRQRPAPRLLLRLQRSRGQHRLQSRWRFA